MIVYLRLGDLVLFAAFLTIAYFLNNVFFGESSRFFSTVAFSLFSGAAILLVSDFTQKEHLLYTFNDNKLQLEFSPLFSITVINGAICIFIAYMSAIRSSSKLPDIMKTSSKKLQIVIITLSIILIGLLISFDLNIFTDTDVFTLSVLIFLNLFYLILFYFFFSDPIYQFNMGLSANRMVEKDYVGYLVGAITDKGPTVVTSSKTFDERIGLEPMDIETLNVGIMTALGINDTYAEKIAIFPVANYENFSIVVFSFQSTFEGIEDPRIQEGTMAIFGIILPSSLLVNMYNISQAQKKISEVINQYDSIESLIKTDEIRYTTIEILNYLTI